MNCPFCGVGDTQVTDTRKGDDPLVIKRRRECQSCGRRFTTYEKPEFSFPLVVKKDGGREEFSPEKVMSGIKKACEKRPVPIEKMESIVKKVEKSLMETGEKEVPSSVIGNIVIEELKKIDKVAYVRFASVYKDFKDITEFVEEVKKIEY